MAQSQEYLDLLDRVAERIPELIQEMKGLHIQKSNAYSGVDNPDTWANFRNAEDYGVSALLGCLVRKEDKIARTKVLLRNPFTDAGDESIVDTWVDEAAYSLIAACLWEEDEAVRQQWVKADEMRKQRIIDYEHRIQKVWEGLSLEDKAKLIMEAHGKR
jgi:hypothetical protein